MRADQNIIFHFYQNLGKLFYAIAAVDGHVRQDEINFLQKLVKANWLVEKLISDIPRKEAENAILETFNWLYADKEYNAEACYNSFISFKRFNEFLFTSHINALILKTVERIATRFSGQNKSELILLAKLHIELRKKNGTAD